LRISADTPGRSVGATLCRQCNEADEFCALIWDGFDLLQAVDVTDNLEVEAPRAGDSCLPEVLAFLVLLGAGMDAGGFAAAEGTACQRPAESPAMPSYSCA